jgi:ubiquitin-protein ligase
LQKRLQKELMKMVKEPPEGIIIDQETLEGKDLST